ncbi:MAG: SdrD B-like domain-containing protein [Anaerolineae bacterium]
MKKHIRVIRLLTTFVVMFSLGLQSLADVTPVTAAGELAVEIIAAPNLVVDSNALSPSTYAPKVATVIGKVCNTGDTAVENVIAYIGDYTNGTPGVYPTETNPTVAAGTSYELTYRGDYAFTHLGGTADASRALGALAAGECRYQYWSFEYPHYAVDDSDGSTIATWGKSVKPVDDLALDFDVWVTGDGVTPADATHTATMRNELSAMANKIKPNGNPPGEWFNTDTSTINVGETITTNGILYRLGNVNQGFDNNDDGVPDYNAWLQPFGDPAYDSSCFRLVGVTGVLTVSRSAGNPDMIIPFENTLYFTDLPSDNTDVRGEVFYKFLALDGACSIPISPYQEVASGFDNEKFNGDYGTGVPAIMSDEPEVTITKVAPGVQAENTTFTYQIPFENTSTESDLGLVLSSGGSSVTTSLVISDTVPYGLQYVGGSASSNNTIPGGNSVSIRFSQDGGTTWTATDPGTVTSSSTNPLVIQWWLDNPLEKSGSGNNSGTVTYQATIPSGYITGGGDPFIENCATGGLGDATPFARDCATTLVQGTGEIGNRVWKDEDGDGLQDTGETTQIDNVKLSLYWDRNGDGQLDDGDVLVQTQDSGTITDGDETNTNYNFTQLPAGDYLMVVDKTDSDIDALAEGYTLTTEEVVAVTLASGGNYNDADFGFGPTLTVDKMVLSRDPAFVDETVSFRIDLINQLPGDGTANGGCVYYVWPSTTGTGQFTNPANAAGAPDGAYATTDLQTGQAVWLSASSFSSGNRTGNITGVEAVTRFYLGAKFNDDVMNFSMSGGAADWEPADFTLAELSTYGPGEGKVGYLYSSAPIPDANAPGGSWDWPDFDAALELRFNHVKNAGPEKTTASINVDALGFRVTTDDTSCATGDTTIATLPLTDTYDADLLEFQYADPAVITSTLSGVAPNTVGLLEWDNLGPLYAGGTKQVTVTFKALAPTSATTNTAYVYDAKFASGRNVNDDNDEVDVGVNASYSISGTTWVDSDDDNWVNTTGYDTPFPGADGPLPNVQMDLYVCSDPLDELPIPMSNDNQTCTAAGYTWSLVATTYTDANGDYIFSGLRSGYYNVQANGTVLPTGMTAQSAEATGDANGAGGAGGNGEWNDQATTLRNLSYLGADKTDVSFGYNNTTEGTVTGYVWQDQDQAGDWSAGEPPISGTTVSLICEGAGCSQASYTTQTDVNGYYQFSNLPTANATYRVQITSPNGMDQSGDPEGGACYGDPGCDDQTNTFTLIGGEVRGPDLFGYTGGLGLSGTVFTDWDGDGGNPEAGEEGLGDVPVYLYRDVDGDGVLDLGSDTYLTETVTASDGTYSFTDLPGNGTKYLVAVNGSAIPVGYQQTADYDVAGTCSGAACDDDASVTINSADVTDVDFGYQPQGLGSIGDTVWADDDGDGVQDSDESGIDGVTVYLYQDQNGDGVVDAEDALVGTDATGGGGLYLFDNLPAGDYIVYVPDSNFDESTDPLYSLTQTNGSRDNLHQISLGDAEVYEDADFGYTNSSVGDFVWQDNNGDGAWQAGEPGIFGVVVELYTDVDNDGGIEVGQTEWLSTTTDADGNYLFGGLGEGNYIVKIADSNFASGGALENYTLTGDPNSYNTNDPTELSCEVAGAEECDGVNTLQGVTAPDSTFFYGLQLGQNDMSSDFGYRPPGGVIGDTVWIDSNDNGVVDVGEKGIAGITVNLCSDATCSTVVMSNTTDAEGYYSFGGLGDGTYYVQVDTGDPDWPTGLTQTYIPDGGGADDQADGVVISGGSVTDIGTVTCTDCDLDVDFGYRFEGLNAIQGTAWHDDDEGGQSGGIGDIDGVETVRYGGLPVYLWRCVDGCGGTDDVLVGQTTTASDGTYSFPDLADGDYRVAVNPNAHSIKGTVTTTPSSYTGISLSGGITAQRDFGFKSAMDMGDLPITYNNSTLGDNGARHTIPDTGAVYLGSAVDADPDGQESDSVVGDDGDSEGDDDDGVAPTGSVNWADGADGASVDVTVGGCPDVCYLSAWIDWNGDGDFRDADERALLDFVVTDGVQTITFDVPAGTFGGSTNLTFNTRYRLYANSTNGLAQPTGLTSNGEVEDYRWQFTPNVVTLTTFTADSVVLPMALAALILPFMAALQLLRLRRRRM